MTAEERLAAYIRSLDAGNSPLLDEIEGEALGCQVPVIRRETQNFLRLLLVLKRPMRILEVGTAVGFSALFMAEYAPKGACITTIEHDRRRILAARENFRRAGREDEITLLEGDAAERLPEQVGPFDFVFMDAAKGQYLNFLPEILRLMEEGAVLVSDNVLQEGDILESRFAVTRRDRTIHKRMREYLYELTHHPKLVTSLLSAGDGIAVSVKCEKGSG